jgi:hypothetical protein
VAYDARLPSGLEPPAVLHPEAEGGGGVKSAGKSPKSKLLGLGVGTDASDCIKQVITRAKFSRDR